MATEKIPKPKYLKSKIQIGNAHGGINYQANQVVFHYDDIDGSKRKRKEEVKLWSKHQEMSSNGGPAGRGGEWNHTTVTNEKFLERRTRENFILDRSQPYQYNYRAESLGPKLQLPQIKTNKFQVTLSSTGGGGEVGRGEGEDGEDCNGKQLYSPTIRTFKRTQEMPVHLKFQNSFETDWNLSNKINKKEFHKQFNELNQKSLQNTQKKWKKLTNYMTPMERSIAFQEEVRKQKRQGEFTLEKHVFHQAEEPVDRKALVNTLAVEPSLKFKTTHHSGIWELNKTEGRYMWSDTGSYQYESRGDVVRVHNPDAYNYSNPTLSKTR